MRKENSKVYKVGNIEKGFSWDPFKEGFKKTKLLIWARLLAIIEASSVSLSKWRDYILNNIDIIPTDFSFPTCQEIHHSRHNPLHSKHLRNRIPHISHDITMKNDLGFPHFFLHIQHWCITMMWCLWILSKWGFSLGMMAKWKRPTSKEP